MVGFCHIGSVQLYDVETWCELSLPSAVNSVSGRTKVLLGAYKFITDLIKSIIIDQTNKYR